MKKSDEKCVTLPGSLLDSLTAALGALDDPNWQRRAAAVQTLGMVAEQLMINPIKKTLEDQDMSVCSAALHTLGAFKACISTAYLVGVARDKTVAWIIREAAVTALERAEEGALAEILRSSLDNELEEYLWPYCPIR